MEVCLDPGIISWLVDDHFLKILKTILRMTFRMFIFYEYNNLPLFTLKCIKPINITDIFKKILPACFYSCSFI